MRLRSIHRQAASALVAAVVLFGLPGMAGAAEWVHCFEPDRQIVRQTAPWDCAGRAVSAAEAEAIRKQRAAYVLGVVQTPPPVRPRSIGSGVFVSRAGDVVTNRHVVETCRAVTVLTPDGETVKAHVLARSRIYDLAVLRTEADPDAVAILSTEALRSGHPVQITGFPVRKLPRVQPAITKGLYLQDHPVGPDGILVLAAKVWGGSSGSSVISATGTVAGLVFARNVTAADPAAAAGMSRQRLPDRTFAIPARAVRSFLQEHGVRLQTAKASAAPPERYTVRVNCL